MNVMHPTISIGGHHHSLQIITINEKRNCSIHVNMQENILNFYDYKVYKYLGIHQIFNLLIFLFIYETCYHNFTVLYL